MSRYYAAVRSDNNWAIVMYADTNKSTWQSRKLGLWERDKHTILTGLSQDVAVSRAAALNNRRAIAKKQTVQPRRRVGIWTS